MSFPLLRALQRDRFFQLLIIVGVVLSLFRAIYATVVAGGDRLAHDYYA
ncbi:Uncharacterised protein [Citrobacter braakii]|nr:Uncharacterised protein [Citrobacter braakii]